MTSSRPRATLSRLTAAFAAFVADERGSAMVEYAAVTGVMTALGLWSERRVGRQVAQMLYQVAAALPG